MDPRIDSQELTMTSDYPIFGVGKPNRHQDTTWGHE